MKRWKSTNMGIALKTTRKPQRPKSDANVRRVQELRRSNAATPVPSAKDREARRVQKYGIVIDLELDDDGDNPYLWK